MYHFGTQTGTGSCGVPFIFGTLETRKNIKIFAMPYRPSTLRHSSAYGRIFEQTHKQRGALYTACNQSTGYRLLQATIFQY